MMRLLKSVSLNGNCDEVKIILSKLSEFHSSYLNSHRVFILSGEEQEIIEFYTNSINTLEVVPTIEIVSEHFGIDVNLFKGITELEDVKSLNYHLKNIMNQKLKNGIQRAISLITSEGGVHTDEGKEKIRKLMAIESLEDKELSPRFDFLADYYDRLSRPSGMKFPISRLNDLAGEMEEGSVNTIGGYTSHFKSVFSMNIAYYNTLNFGFNGVFFSLETPKNVVYNQLISRHSVNNCNIPGYMGISHKKVKELKLNKEELDEFTRLYSDWDDKRLGNLFILDESDLDIKSPSEFYDLLEKIDDMLDGNLHYFVIDYIQILKYCSFTQGMTDAQSVGMYMEAFREWSQGFRKGTKREKKLVAIVCSQISRTGKDYADSNEGEYHSPGVLSDSSEIEKASHRVVSTYTSDDMKAVRTAYAQVLKARGGETSGVIKVTAMGEYSFYGDSEIINDVETFQDSDSLGVGDVLGSALMGDDILNEENSIFNNNGGGLW